MTKLINGGNLIKKIIFIIIFCFALLISINSVMASDNATCEVKLDDITTNVDAYSGSFTDLQKEIKSSASNSKLYLSGTYRYNKKTDVRLKDGVYINKDITIIGKKDCTIDGNNLARCLRIKEGCTVTLKNIKIKNGYTNKNGAGIKIDSNSKVTVKNCVFENNYAKNSNGGAIACKKSCTIKIFSSTFKNNKATYSKKTLDPDKKGMGSVIRTSIGCNLKIYDSKFKSNEAFLAMILVVSYTDTDKKTSTLYMNKCSFIKNKSDYNGVIYSDEYGKCTIKNSKFTYNKSPRGAGAIVVESSKYALIKNCVFYKNKGCNGAGVNVKIYNSKDTSKVEISNCKFTKNTASMYGGAICSVGGKVTIKKCEFTSNKAPIFGGAVYARLGTMDISSSKFNKNKAGYAGALCLACKKSTVKSSSITKNHAYYLYGGVYNIDHNTLSKCHVKSNKVLKYSKVYLSKSGKSINVKVTDNTGQPIKKHVQLLFSGSKKVKTKWYKTSTKKSKKIKIPKSVKGTYKVTMKVKSVKYLSKTICIKV